MTVHDLIVAALLGVAVLACLAASLGVLVMHDAWQRLQYGAVIVTWGSAAVALAVWLDNPAIEARLKTLLAGAILFVTNAILASATAKAVRLRRTGHWAPHDDEKIPVVGRDDVAGARGHVEEHRA